MTDHADRDPGAAPSVEETLNARGGTYGTFYDLSNTAQTLKQYVRTQPGWRELSFVQREALDMIATKIARILNGNPEHLDSWHDIAGYATLVVDDLAGVRR